MGNLSSSSGQSKTNRRQSTSEYQTVPNIPDDNEVERPPLTPATGDDETTRRGGKISTPAKIRVLDKGKVFITFDDNASGNSWGYHSEKIYPHITEIYEVIINGDQVEIHGAASPSLNALWRLTVVESVNGVPSTPRFTSEDSVRGPEGSITHKQFTRVEDKFGRTALSFNTVNKRGTFYLVPRNNRIEIGDEKDVEERHFFQISGVKDDDDSVLRPAPPDNSVNESEGDSEKENEEEEEEEEEEGAQVILEQKNEDCEQFVK